ncbi:hypothetical protein ACN4EG_22525 [Alkalinema pantanalense CENA528]
MLRHAQDTPSIDRALEALRSSVLLQMLLGSTLLLFPEIISQRWH